MTTRSLSSSVATILIMLEDASLRHLVFVVCLSDGIVCVLIFAAGDQYFLNTQKFQKYCKGDSGSCEEKKVSRTFQLLQPLSHCPQANCVDKKLITDIIIWRRRTCGAKKVKRRSALRAGSTYRITVWISLKRH